jgi:hypothetical protein
MIDEPELMLYATQFCQGVENIMDDLPRDANQDEARLKLAKCRQILILLQDAFDADELSIARPAVRAQFRVLIIHLLWITFRIRQVIDLKLYRIFVQLEAGFTHLLTLRP